MVGIHPALVFLANSFYFFVFSLFFRRKQKASTPSKCPTNKSMDSRTTSSTRPWTLRAPRSQLTTEMETAAWVYLQAKNLKRKNTWASSTLHKTGVKSWIWTYTRMTMTRLCIGNLWQPRLPGRELRRTSNCLLIGSLCSSRRNKR